MAEAAAALSALGSVLRAAREAHGLSRAALAARAGCTRQYVEMLESGDRAHPRAAMLASLAAALALTEETRAGLFAAAGAAPPASAPVVSEPATALASAFARTQPYPALVLDPCWSLLDWNGLLPAAFEVYPARLPVESSNLLRLLCARELRSRVLNWDEAAPALVARFKRETRSLAHDPALQQTLRELRTLPGFASLYRSARADLDPAARLLGLQHRRFGPLWLAWLLAAFAQQREPRLLVFLPADRASAAALEQLRAEQGGRG
ncbi:MAG TPA: helix-turn-helix domain-containing protein [Dehalococcoidia bacterium]|nr:helix-turn-helix domain-containing protein [Dehalococcoidia bacterium]